MKPVTRDPSKPARTVRPVTTTVAADAKSPKSPKAAKTTPPPSQLTPPAEAAAPELFRRAVASLQATVARREVHIEAIRPPQRLAPWTYALTADILDAEGEELATGRLVLLHDPEGSDAWDGVLRLVAFASAELEPDIASDPALPEVCWSWLTEGLVQRRADHLAVGGTVTQTTSTRFGDVHGPKASVAIELRGSWTARTADLSPHLLGFLDMLCTAAGLPPEGVTVLQSS